MKKRLIVGISGASGSPLAVEVLNILHSEHPEVEVHLVVTKSAEITLKHETGMSVSDLASLAEKIYDIDSIWESISSGSFKTMGLLVVPCSMKTAAGICAGYSDNLLLRAADVCLKEKRKIVLAARETPLSTVHLRNLYELSQMGVVIAPPMLTSYIFPAAEGSADKCTNSRPAEDSFTENQKLTPCKQDEIANFQSTERKPEINSADPMAKMIHHAASRLLQQFDLSDYDYEWQGFKKMNQNKYTATREFLNQPITAETTVLPGGIVANVTGGDLPHVGAISIVDPDGGISTTQFPTHKDGEVSELFAGALAKIKTPVAVIAGIHYDNLSGENIGKVITLVSDMLDETIANLSMQF